MCVLMVPDSSWPHGCSLPRLLYPWNFPGKNTGVGCRFLLQEIFLTQRSNPSLLHCRQILYHSDTRESLPMGWPIPFASIYSVCPLHGSQPCHGEGACVTQWSYEPCCAGPPKMEESEWRVLTNRGPLEELMATLQLSCHREPHRQYEKAKWLDTERGTLQVSRCPICYWRSVEKELQKKWRHWAQAKTTASCGYDWWWKSDAIKNNMA